MLLLELWSIHWNFGGSTATKIQESDCLRFKVEIFAPFSASFSLSLPLSPCLISSFYTVSVLAPPRGCSDIGLRWVVGWVGTKRRLSMGGCCSWLGIPQLILSHDSPQLRPTFHPPPHPLVLHPKLLSPQKPPRLEMRCPGLSSCPAPAPPLLVAVALVAGSRPWRHPQPGSGGSEAGRAEMAAC